MIADFLVPLVAVGLAELGDKTQLSVLLLSSKTNRHASLLLGIVLAFMVVDGIAVVAGSWITSIVSPDALKVVSGVLFILFGLLMLKNSNLVVDERFRSGNPFLAGFLLIFITEWGDKTQLASTIFATKYDALLVFMGSMVSLTLLSVAAVYLGKLISTQVDRRVMTKIAAILFLLLGLASFLL